MINHIDAPPYETVPDFSNYNHTILPHENTHENTFHNEPIRERINITSKTIVEGKKIEATTIGSTSMTPTLQVNNTIAFEHGIDVSKLSKGDIIVYNSGRKDYPRIVHRIIWKNDTHFIPKGDNNSRDDGVFELNKIDGVVIATLY